MNIAETDTVAAPGTPHAFVFVIHGGGLEAKSAILACSLRQKLMGGQRIVAIRMSPAELWSPISSAAESLLDALDIDCVDSENQIDPDYPHGNKINSLGSIDGPAIFLDSDMMMMRPFINHYALLGVDAVAKAADIDTFSRGGGSWSRVYRLFDLPMPSRTFTATSSGERMRPYFNAGFIGVRDGRSFAKCWLETARIIDRDDKIENKRPWLDQIALPITFERLGWHVGEAPSSMNFPAHLNALPNTLPYLVHYHFPHVLLKSDRLRADLDFYMSKFPDLRQILSNDPSWADAV